MLHYVHCISDIYHLAKRLSLQLSVKPAHQAHGLVSSQTPPQVHEEPWVTESGCLKTLMPPCHPRMTVDMDSWWKLRTFTDKSQFCHFFGLPSGCCISPALRLERGPFCMQGVVSLPNYQERTLQRALVGSTINVVQCYHQKGSFRMLAWKHNGKEFLLSVLKTVFLISHVIGAGKIETLKYCIRNGHKRVCRSQSRLSNLVPIISSWRICSTTCSGVVVLMFVPPTR